ncbi:hypothetical protein KFE25_003256 [Diacronema lutheri]|uniref:Vesicle-fusing ATPase n=1 Tax=Diacronema lutheri TaxID=2081491 RepID=A0A8J5XCN8_DIALT|nr:hypothetical protein KFE25_003256 [Diacronema lutheri]
MALVLRAANCPNQELALTNCVFVSRASFSRLPGDEPKYLQLRQFVYVARSNDAVEGDGVGLNSVQRKLLAVSVGDELQGTPWRVPGTGLCRLTLEVDFVRKATVRGTAQLDGSAIVEAVMRRYAHQVFAVGQQVAIDFQGSNLLLTVSALTVAPLAELTSPSVVGVDAQLGLLNAQTFIVLTKAQGAPLALVGMDANRQGANQIIKSDFNFEQMGIGGLDAEFSDIFRRAFASRIFPPAVLKQLGVQHVRGMLLYGPPGTGKTLMARQIGKMLNGREPKIVNGPEVLSKYVGQSEENIRKLFADAEAEQAEQGDDSSLHIIIFDEIDAICKQRGRSNDSTGVHDTVVNQLLSKIDGVNALNNILLIGMTNRKDMIDDALLRPGRLEVQIEIHLPDEAGREQILKIKTANMRKGGYLAPEVSVADLAARAKNFSGAELEGLVKSATSYAFSRQVHVDNLKDVSIGNLRVGAADFDRALTEVKPAFGVAGDDLAALVSGGIVEYGPSLRHLVATADSFMKQLQASQRVNRMAILLEGPPGAGKTALAAHLALRSAWPFVKLVSPDRYVGLSEGAKVAAIARVFDDALKSPLSCVVLDDLERLLEYVRIGPRFSNLVLQTLIVCVRRAPTRGKLLVLATTSCSAVLSSLEMLDAFNSVLPVRCLDPSEAGHVLAEVGGMPPAHVAAAQAAMPAEGLPIKKLLLVLEMAALDGKTPTADAFIQCMHEVAN